MWRSVAEVTALMREQKSYPVEQFSYDLEMKTREQNRNNKRTEIERFDLIGLSNGYKRARLLVG